MSSSLEPRDFRLRPYGEAGDVEAVHAIIHGCVEADDIDPYSTLESLPTLEAVRRWLADLDPRHVVLAAAGERVVGYNWITWWTEADGLMLYLHLGQVLPAERKQGIGTALLGWSEARIQTLAAEHGSYAMYGANASSTELDATRLLRDNGYQVVFTVGQMEYTGDFSTLIAVPLPEGVVIRAPKPEDAEAMWQARMDAYLEIPLFGVPAPNQGEIDEIRAGIAAGGQFWRCAWAGDEIASEIWCSIHDYEGSQTAALDEVHTVPKFQRKGIGRALMTHVLLMLRDMGITRVRLHTDDGNRRGAKTFYEQLGFKTLKTFLRYRKPLT